MTQSELGAVVHAHAGTVSRWEAGTRAPDQWQQQILRMLQEAVRRRPEVADEAKAAIDSGATARALGILLSAASE